MNTFFTAVAYAQGQSQGFALPNPTQFDSIQELIAAILDVIVMVATPFLVLAVIWSGFLFVTSRGNPEKLTRAKQTILYTLIGAALIIGASVLSGALSDVIGEITNVR
jgi:hypothetical protein